MLQPEGGAVPPEVVLVRPERLVLGSENTPVGKIKKCASRVVGLCHLSGYDYGVSVGDAHQSFIETPMAQFAKGHAIADIIVLADAPRNNVRRIDGGVAFRRYDTRTAERAPVIVMRHDGPAKTLVSGCGLVFLWKDWFRDLLLMCCLFQHAAVLKSVRVNAGLFAHGLLTALGKARSKQ